ncbi:alpha/beta hydrolase [Corynebacterium sp. sy017]|uniref:alpha/beta fold hydrolase n=1 Tax=unclassified Corynebacterium TaxID=2624378 RepID=UPI001184CC11|nr:MULTISPECIES: alpha/beta hydrolase [unclassified Corynebacterium]MBP3088038.1 alpha/beta hydrolase [Corynebacterium sp. sy017]TSD92566.1 alpha/beta hydrolase [Corynebacterium sp. SY003]
MAFLRLTKRSKRNHWLASVPATPPRGEEHFSTKRTVGKNTYFLTGPEDSAVTVVFVHGFTLAATQWQYQTEEIAHRARCLLPDFRGHGQTPQYPVAECSVDGAADDVYAAITDANITGPIILVGHSLGGMVSFNLLRRYPKLRKQIRGMVLIATAIESFSGKGTPQLLKLPVADDIRNAMEISPEEAQKLRSEFAALIAPTLGVTMFKNSGMSPAVKLHAQLLNSTPIETYVGFLDDLEKHDELAAAQAVADIPAVVIVGDKDDVTPLAQAEKICELMPHAALQVIPQAGHMLPLENPAVVNKAIAHFIAQ